MNRKKITKAALTGLVAVSMVPAMTSTLLAEGQEQTSIQEKKPGKPSNDTARIEVVYISRNQGVERKVGAGLTNVITLNTFYTFEQLGAFGLPENYEVMPGQTFKADSKTDSFKVYVEPKAQVPETKTIKVQYVCEGRVYGTEDVKVDYDATYITVDQLNDVPYGWKVKDSEKIYLDKEGNAQVEIVKDKVTRDVVVQYIDSNNHNILRGRETLYDIDNTQRTINTSVLQEVPDGWEIVNEGNVDIVDGKVTVYVKAKEETKDITVNYINEDKTIVRGTEVIEDLDINATSFDSGLLKKVPEGFVIANPGEISIDINNEAWVVVTPEVQTKDIIVNYVNEEKTVKFGTEIVRDVDIDAVSINTNILKNVPEKFEIAYPGEASISADNQVWIVVKPAQETKLVPVIFWDILTQTQVSADEDKKVGVDADATSVPASEITALLPKGYVLDGETKDYEINTDGTIRVNVKPESQAQTVSVIFWDVENGKQVAKEEDKKIGVAQDVQSVERNQIVGLIPEGYELYAEGEEHYTKDFSISTDIFGHAWIRVDVKEIKDVDNATATLIIKYVENQDDKNVEIAEETFTKEGPVNEISTFTVSITAPEGYKLVNENVDAYAEDVKNGDTVVKYFFVEAIDQTAAESDNASDEDNKNKTEKEAAEETDGTNTGVAMSLAGVFGTMSAALAGMVALLRRKQK